MNGPFLGQEVEQLQLQRWVAKGLYHLSGEGRNGDKQNARNTGKEEVVRTMSDLVSVDPALAEAVGSLMRRLGYEE